MHEFFAKFKRGYNKPELQIKGYSEYQFWKDNLLEPLRIIFCTGCYICTELPIFSFL